MATITEFLVRLHPWSLVENGAAAFNGGLLGSVVAALHPILLPDSSHPNLEMALSVLIGAVARYKGIHKKSVPESGKSPKGAENQKLPYSKCGLL